MRSKIRRFLRPEEWREWWAWYPVYVWVEPVKIAQCIWLELVERRLVTYGYDDVWEYRIKDQ